jgi:uncharacterized membrane protein YccC
MSAESATVIATDGANVGDPRTRQVLRYAVGSTLAMALALGIGWPLSFLTPVLALSFLATPAPRPTLKAGIGFVLVIVVACLAGLVLSRLFLPYPFVHIPLIGLVLFRLFDAKARGAPMLPITFTMIAVLLIPYMALQAQVIANLIAAALVVGAAATIGVVWLAYGLFPDPFEQPAGPGSPAGPAPHTIPSPQERFREAAMSTLVVMPLLILFYVFQWSSALLILIFVALLSMQPAIARSVKAGVALIIGNAIGGLAAIVIYEILVIVPSFGFMLVLMLLAGLLFGTRVFSTKPSAALFKMAFSTTILVVASTTSSDAEAGAKAYTRVLQLMVVVIYVIAAFGVLDRFSRRREA